MQLFYSPFIQDQSILLDAEESAHALRVLRKKVGDSISVTDGKGNLYETKIVQIDSKKTQLEILNTEIFQPRKRSLHIAISPTKNNDRFEWFLEKACEFGIEEITPIICERSERKVVKAERLEKILVAGMKQSLHYFLPKLNESINLIPFLKQEFDLESDLAIAHCMEGEKTTIWEFKKNKALILIGPEGDFTPKELVLASEKEFQSITLGNSRLRTETAGIAAVHEFALRAVNGL